MPGHGAFSGGWACQARRGRAGPVEKTGDGSDHRSRLCSRITHRQSGPRCLARPAGQLPVTAPTPGERAPLGLRRPTATTTGCRCSGASPGGPPPGPRQAIRYDNVTISQWPLVLGAARLSSLPGGAFSARTVASRPATAPARHQGYRQDRPRPPKAPRSFTSALRASSATSRLRAAANSATFSAAGSALGACALIAC